MKAKKFKEIVSQIPDDDEFIFTYSMFEFENVGNIFNGKEIIKSFNSQDEKDCITHDKSTWMIEIKN